MSMSPGARKHFCKIPDDERCEAFVELHVDTTIQRIGLYEYHRCLKRHKGFVFHKSGTKMNVCGVHRRMALEGKIAGSGAVMPKQHRSDCYMYDRRYCHEGEWSEEAKTK